MHKTYKTKVKRLQKTGEGIDQAEGHDIYLECYIGADGPNSDTPQKYRNIWSMYLCLCKDVLIYGVVDEIEKEFPFFSRFHRFCSTRANTVPPAVTTGIGPRGRETVHYQAPNSGVPGASQSEQPSESAHPLQLSQPGEFEDIYTPLSPFLEPLSRQPYQGALDSSIPGHFDHRPDVGTGWDFSSIFPLSVDHGAKENIPPIPVLRTPATPQPSQVTRLKSVTPRATPTGKKAKASSFPEALLAEARTAISRVPTKRGLEDTLSDIML